MKCNENGGCPFGIEVRGEHQCWVTPSFVKRCSDELRYKRCHLSSSDFPIISAMIAGEFNYDLAIYSWRTDHYVVKAAEQEKGGSDE